MRNKKILLGFVETETGVHATYIFNREIQKERLSLFAQQGYSEKDLEFESLDDLLEDLTDNKVYLDEYDALKVLTMGYFKELLQDQKSSSSGYKNLEEKFEESIKQKETIEGLGLDPKKINVGYSEVKQHCFTLFGEVSLEEEDNTGFALAIFKEVFDWLESCVRDEDYELVKTNPEYLYLINPEIVIPCAFTQFNLEEYVKEWKVKEYLRNLFEEMNCLKEFEEDFR
ncbi:MAG: hypothetical protein CL760_07060 [Chloroflexi bacterium]|nr:hypothetical protein [Chloroflexota bacterium]|tara:strand:+ start:65012 stop:65695 length:684 start_codon:yes stop_codon:yes gene_type:complete